MAMEQNQIESTKRLETGAADAAPEERPGVPMERAPRPMEGAPRPLTRQVASVEVLHHAQRSDLTPVFGTAAPPRGLSGALRRAAYRIPETQVKHWMGLLLADRVDVIESRLKRGLVPAALLGLALLAGTRALGRQRSWSRRGRRGLGRLLGV